MKKKEKVDEVVLKPTMNRVLVELVEEAKTYENGITNVYAGFEPYCLIVAVGPQIVNLKVGEYALMRLNLKADVFKLRGKKYAILTEFDLTAVVPEEILPELKNHKIDQSKPELVTE